jgi:hypothetical protein
MGIYMQEMIEVNLADWPSVKEIEGLALRGTFIGREAEALAALVAQAVDPKDGLTEVEAGVVDANTTLGRLSFPWIQVKSLDPNTIEILGGNKIVLFQGNIPVLDRGLKDSEEIGLFESVTGSVIGMTEVWDKETF